MIKFFILFFLINYSVYSARLAIVTNSKAILYADSSLDSPIGYISKGKKVYIGNKNFLSDKITTVIVSGKLAFIKTSDILINSDLMKEDFQKQKQQDYLRENLVDQKKELFYYIFSTAYLLPFNFIGHLKSAANLNVTNFSTFSLLIDIERYSSKSRYFWGLGVNYFNYASSGIAYRSLILNVKFGWQLFRSELLNINISSGLNISGDYRVEFTNIQKNKGQLLGANIETYLHLFPRLSWSIKGGLGLNQNIVFAINNIKMPGKTDRLSETSYGSTYLFLSLSKYF